jgi:GT2 family glycosyltransferase
LPNPEKERIQILQQQLSDYERYIHELQNSKSWKITRPFRWIHSRLAQFLGSQNSFQTTKSPEPFVHSTRVNEARDAASSRARTTLAFHLSTKARVTLPFTEKPKISVLIVAFNRAELTLMCLLSLIKNPPQELEVVIVDNGSDDETADLLNQVEGLRKIRNDKNMHFIHGANQAASEARGEYILFLNNDTELFPGSIQSALNTIESSSNIGAVGAKLILPDGSLQEAGSIVWRDGSCAAYGRGDNPFAPQYMFMRDADFCSAAFLLTKREEFLSNGGFDESYKPAYYEDADYCLKLWKKGLRVIYDPNAALIHHEFGSASTSAEAIQLQDTNRRIFVTKHVNELANQPEPGRVNLLDARLHSISRKKILFVDDRVPHSTIGSGFPRAHAILLSLLRLNCFVTCYPMFFINEDWPSVYSDIPENVEVFLNAGHLALTKFLEERKHYYDVVIVSRPPNMEVLQQIRQRRKDLFGKTRVIYDSEALFSLRDAALQRAKGEEVNENELQKSIRNEIALAKNADAVLSASQSELETLAKHGSSQISVLGHCIKAVPTSRSFSQRDGFLFVGAIHNDQSPNADALRWFIKEIFPLIQKDLGNNIGLSVAGINHSDSIASLGGERIHMAGYREDLTGLYDQARVFVAPTRYSAGIPIKILSAASYGLPVVATQLLADQLGWTNGKELLVADTAQDFAQNCVKLYNNSDLWQAIRENAVTRVTEDCSQETFDRTLKNILFP